MVFVYAANAAALVAAAAALAAAAVACDVAAATFASAEVKENSNAQLSLDANEPDAVSTVTGIL